MAIRWSLRSMALLMAALALGPNALPAQTPKVLELRTQKVEQTTYFQVRIERPADLRLPEDRRNRGRFDERAFDLLPRLVPQDDRSKAVYLSGRGIDALAGLQRVQGVKDKKGQWVDALEFVGKVQENGQAKLLLLYPKAVEPLPKDKQSLAELVKQHGTWVEVPLTLDFSMAAKAELPAVKRNRRSRRSPRAKSRPSTPSGSTTTTSKACGPWGNWRASSCSKRRRRSLASIPLPGRRPAEVHGLRTAAVPPVGQPGPVQSSISAGCTRSPPGPPPSPNRWPSIACAIPTSATRKRPLDRHRQGRWASTLPSIPG